MFKNDDPNVEYRGTDKIVDYNIDKLKNINITN